MGGLGVGDPRGSRPGPRRGNPPGNPGAAQSLEGRAAWGRGTGSGAQWLPLGYFSLKGPQYLLNRLPGLSVQH